MYLENVTTVTQFLWTDYFGPSSDLIGPQILLLVIGIIISIGLYDSVKKLKASALISCSPFIITLALVLVPEQTTTLSPVLSDNYDYTITTHIAEQPDEFGVNQNTDTFPTVSLTFAEDKTLPSQLYAQSEAFLSFFYSDKPATLILGTIGEKGMTFVDRNLVTFNDSLRLDYIQDAYNDDKYLIITKEQLGPIYDELVEAAKQTYENPNNPFGVKTAKQ